MNIFRRRATVDGKKFVCVFCNKGFERATELKGHIMGAHIGGSRHKKEDAPLTSLEASHQDSKERVASIKSANKNQETVCFHGKRARFTKAEKEQIKTLWEEGYTVNDISKKVKHSTCSLKKHIWKMQHSGELGFKNKSKENAMLILPDFISPEVWQGFVEMRKAIKKPLTPYACELIIKKLTKLHYEGRDVNEALSKSIIHNWQGVF